jgi:hypothetical protein
MTGMNTRITVFLAVLLLLAVPAALFAAAYDALVPLLVDLAGWQAEAAEGIDLSQAGMQGVTVVREYKSGGKGLTAAIMLGSQAGITWMPEYKEGFKGQSDEGSMEVKRINGFLVYEAYNKDDAAGGVVVLLIETTAGKPDSGAVLVVSFEEMSLDEGLKLAQKFDWKKMKDAAGKVK